MKAGFWAYVVVGVVLAIICFALGLAYASATGIVGWLSTTINKVSKLRVG